MTLSWNAIDESNPEYPGSRWLVQPLMLLLPDLESLCDHDFAISGDPKKRASNRPYSGIFRSRVRRRLMNSRI